MPRGGSLDRSVCKAVSGNAGSPTPASAPGRGGLCPPGTLTSESAPWVTGREGCEPGLLALFHLQLCSGSCCLLSKLVCSGVFGGPGSRKPPGAAILWFHGAHGTPRIPSCESWLSLSPGPVSYRGSRQIGMLTPSPQHLCSGRPACQLLSGLKAGLRAEYSEPGLQTASGAPV